MSRPPRAMSSRLLGPGSSVRTSGFIATIVPSRDRPCNRTERAEGWAPMPARALGRRALAAMLACALCLVCGAASADQLDEVRSGGKLLWGGDQEGGGPYVMPR